MRLGVGIVCGYAWAACFTYRSAWALAAALILTVPVLVMVFGDTRVVRRVLRRWAVAGARRDHPWMYSRLSDEEVERRIFGDVVE